MDLTSRSLLLRSGHDTGGEGEFGAIVYGKTDDSLL